MSRVLQFIYMALQVYYHELFPKLSKLKSVEQQLHGKSRMFDIIQHLAIYLKQTRNSFLIDWVGFNTILNSISVISRLSVLLYMFSACSLSMKLNRAALTRKLVEPGLNQCKLGISGLQVSVATDCLRYKGWAQLSDEIQLFLYLLGRKNVVNENTFN